jgi:hypothetical protein
MYSKLEALRKKQALRLKLVAGDKPEEKKEEEPKAEEKPAEPEEKKEAKGEDKVVPVPKKKRFMVADEANLGKEEDK